MKKILSIILTVIVIANLFLMVGCDKTHENSHSQLEETTTVTSNDSKPNSKPVAVNTLNGMTLTQLYENFIEEYTTADAFDISIVTNATLDGAQTTSSVRLTLTNYATYIMADAADAKIECWFFEDSSYLNLAGEKYKMSNITADDIFGQDFIELTLSSIVYDTDNFIYLEKLEEAQLYLHNDEYYCYIAFTDQEALSLGLEAEAFSETLFFDAQGKIKKIIDQSSTEEITVILDVYNNTLLINAPADKDSYIEQTIPEEDDSNQDTPEDLSGIQNPLLYAEYQSVFQAIKNARKFQMIVTTKGSSILFYTVVKNNACVSVLENGVYCDRWYVDGKGYVCENNGTVFSTEVTESFLSYFNSAQAQKDFVAGLQLHGNDINDFSVSKQYSSSKITLSHNNTDGTVDFYEITSHYPQGKVDSAYITITRSLNGTQLFSIEYAFLNIDSVYLKDLVAPI